MNRTLLKMIPVIVGVICIGLTFMPNNHLVACTFFLYQENHLIPALINAHPSPTPWYEAIESEWGGQVKLRGSASWVDNDSFYQLVGTGQYYDGTTEGRLKTKLLFDSWGYFEAHYELIFSGGDTRRKSRTLARRYPDIFGSDFPLNRTVEDNRRLMDLTKTIDDDERYILYHRLDRFSLTFLLKWGVIRIGRQAVTWGNGLLFNPMDLFNPFSPTDIERDYKIGDDLVSVELPFKGSGNAQVLCVPRRNPNTQIVQWDQSSLAAKLHLKMRTTEVDMVAAKHYGDVVLGLGGTGYLKDAAWRLDFIGTILNNTDCYISLVANIDYSWLWAAKNWYGFLEFYFNGLSHNRYSDELTNSDISERLARGELFTLGRTYLGGHIISELHPLFNAYLTAIVNLADPSTLLQPYAVWDIIENVQITLGGNIFLGERGTEFGGFILPGTNLLFKPPDRAFLWVSYFF